jgi:hypothetical protein
MKCAAAYGEAAEGGLIVSSNDPRALRLYADFGFALHPTFEASGVVDRRRLPGVRGAEVREDDGEDLEALAGLTRSVRGAPYTGELGLALVQGARVLRVADRGFAAAGALLWSALALADGSARVRWITGAQQWAIDIVARAGLRLAAYGALCVRGAPGPLAPFLPNNAFA